jgi:hypothetical protein
MDSWSDLPKASVMMQKYKKGDIEYEFGRFSVYNSKTDDSIYYDMPKWLKAFIDDIAKNSFEEGKRDKQNEIKKVLGI